MKAEDLQEDEIVCIVRTTAKQAAKTSSRINKKPFANFLDTDDPNNVRLIMVPPVGEKIDTLCWRLGTMLKEKE